MATPEDKATDLKNQGNKAFAAHDWPTAIDLYSQAIELNGKEPTFWSNRAQAYLKTEAYGFAVRDATKAIELKPSFVKVRNDPISPHIAAPEADGSPESRPTTGERPHTPPS